MIPCPVAWVYGESNKQPPARGSSSSALHTRWLRTNHGVTAGDLSLDRFDVSLASGPLEHWQTRGIPTAYDENVRATPPAFHNHETVRETKEKFGDISVLCGVRYEARWLVEGRAT